ncbi:hypothetical protein H5123_02270 [Shewanella sp. SR43-4]|jgi:hypothetical protein|uniref:Uncharacterized protein n=1 Tax=Shewanella vesiculosa TaxID=518738 RepID=A0ABV0FUK9_9GAMM|nr:MULTISPECIES: hypothetical protein [Shewanella]NCQ45092.1 hypothetical protein [Shewanella frigidimarina]MBB1316474.1 hypothetical protein [Shewanella sp. SR43-4]MBB1323216.1 hypothetical protein [Shewanella sp. SR43-8]MBB1390648.1 hypothetical protein [Shewanella sp. SG44-6]MBB1475601.1 hypothetical protein [Shewanella sp. SG41-3]|tara:strand:+ start:5404 stop:5916 length:513 start_codon:yes stop_codon:yes gene_type:complete
MKKSIVNGLMSATLILTASTSVMADEQGHHINSNAYKMVLIEDVPGVNALQSGDVQQGLTATLSASKYTVDDYSRNVNLCAGYVQLSDMENAEKACDAAVKSARTQVAIASMVERAYAYNNRGIMKLINNDKLGALADFKYAAKVDNSSIYQHNVERLQASLTSTQDGMM